MQWAKTTNTRGFTIVELLIVIVVIGILASITIVAYNGIQGRARTVAVQSTASQVGRNLMAFASSNNQQYPTKAQFADASFRTGTIKLPSETNTLRYDYQVSVDQLQACVSVADPTANPVVAYAYTQTGQVVEGRCVENLVSNPSFESTLSGWGWNTAGSGGGSSSNPSTGAFSGQRSARYTFSANSSLGVFGPYAQVTGLNATSSYVATAWVRSNKALTYQIRVELRNASSSQIGTIAGSTVTLSPGVWTPVRVEIPPTTNLSRLTLCVYGAGTTVSGDYIEYDGAMLTEGAINSYYAGGDESLWTPTDSTSVGPARTFVQ